MSVDVTSLLLALPIVALVAFGVYFIPKGWRELRAPEEVSEPSRSAPGGPFRWASWILATLFLAVSVPKIGGLAEMLHQFGHWGYSETFMYAIGAVEFVGAILLLIPRVRLFAALALSGVMVGAIYTHLTFDSAALVALPMASLAALVYIGLGSWHREWDARPTRAVQAAGGAW